MPNIIDQIANRLNDQLNAENKQENRATACFRAFEEENIDVCNLKTREVVTKIDNTIKKDSSGKYDVEHCLSAFSEIGLVDCTTLPEGFALKINSGSCFDLLKNNDIELCFSGSGMRCTKSNYWEEEISDWRGKELLELCIEKFKKYSLVSCGDKIFNASKCFNILKQKENTLYFRNEWVIIDQENFDNLCCKGPKKDAPFCYAFSSKEFDGEYNIESCQKELAGLDIYPLATHDEI